MDYGFTDPLALVRVAVDNDYKKIYLDEIIYKSELSNKALLRLIDQGIIPNGLICADHNEKRTTTYLYDKGINIVKAIKPKISENIRAMQDYQIIVTPRSINLKEELNEYKWNDKKAEIPIDDFNHAIDSARYGFNELKRV
jgi:phage terminase large subunit